MLCRAPAVLHSRLLVTHLNKYETGIDNRIPQTTNGIYFHSFFEYVTASNGQIDAGILLFRVLNAVRYYALEMNSIGPAFIPLKRMLSMPSEKKKHV